MQASAAATLEGKPDDVDFGPSSGPGLGGGGIGSWSDMFYIHRMQIGLSSNLAFRALFSLSLLSLAEYHALLTALSMAKSSPPPVALAFTLIELLVVIATIGILAAILIPSLNSALESAKATKDLSNLRQIGALMQSYLNDKDQILPAINAVPGLGTNASPVIYPKYVGTRNVFQSPFDKRVASETDTAPVSYGINQNIYDLIGGNMLRVVSPASTFFMAPNYAGTRKRLLMDGHVCQQSCQICSPAARRGRQRELIVVARRSMSYSAIGIQKP